VGQKPRKRIAFIDIVIADDFVNNKNEVIFCLRIINAPSQKTDTKWRFS